MKTAIWLLLLQASLGAFDTLYYHEFKLRLPYGDNTRVELRLHAMRDLCYAVIIGSLGFATWQGLLAYGLAAILLGEIVITLWDFVEEDKVRRLPPGERCTHAVMGIVYGAFLGYLLPELWHWSGFPTGWGRSYHGIPAWILSMLALGVFASGVRDFISSMKPHPRLT